MIMINHGIVYSATRPQDTEITKQSVFVASEIEPYEHEFDGHVVQGYQYNLMEYGKDEYIHLLEADLLDTQAALCDIYELLEGGLE